MNYYLLAALSVAFVALSAADLIQSLKLQKLGAVENNPVLGKHPAPKKMILFAVVTTGLWLAAAIWLTLKGAPGVAAVFLFAIFLRIWTIVKGRKLMEHLKGEK